MGKGNRRTPGGLLLFLAVLGACGDAGDERPRNVILVCMDTVRADHLGCYGYERETTPTLDALAQRSIVFEDASATACWTKPSVPSFLTGTYPIQHGVYSGSSRDEVGAHSDVLPQDATTLAEAFRRAGYATAAFVKNAQLRRGLGFEQGFDEYVDEAGDAREIRWRTRDWLDDHDGEQPFFLYLHFLDAHWPYPVPDEYATRWTRAEEADLFRGKDWRELRAAINDGQRGLSSSERNGLIGLYDGALRFIDDQLGLLLADLERRGLMEDTVVCVISDHGEEFLEHGRIGHGHGLYEGLLRVPWILHVPGVAAQRVTNAVSLIDVFPTLLSAAGVAQTGTDVGVDRLDRPAAIVAILAEHLEKGSYRQSLRRGTAKLVVVGRPSAAAARETESASRLPSPGARVEARLEPDDRGGFSAVRLRPDDGDVLDPTEIKGPVTGLTESSFRLCGILIQATAATLYGEVTDARGQPRGLALGELVKARGTFAADGSFVAERVKLYAPGTEVEFELRGTVTAAEPPDRLRIGDHWIELASEVQVIDLRARSRLSREFVLESLLSAAGPWSRFETQERLLDLDLDPAELAPSNAQAGAQLLREELARLIPTLALTRLWSRTDRAALSAGDLEALRAIGYAE